MKKLAGFVVVFLVLLGCSREVDIMTPMAESEVEARLSNTENIPMFPMVNEELVATEYQVVSLFPGGYMLYVKPFSNKHTDLIIILTRTGGLVNALVYPEGTFSVYGQWLKLKPNGDPREIIGVYIHGVLF